MATYVISDIHGALDEFHRLLKKIGFRYDGSDELYLLGDYADWGEKSIETLLVVKELDEKYPFVHCVMGNHEWMFLSTVLSGSDGFAFQETAENWLYHNKGLVTWRGFCRLDKETQADLALWMQGLAFSYDVTLEVTLGEEKRMRTFHLAHAYPYFGEDCTEEEKHYRQTDAVWRRLMIREDPFAGYTGDKHYDMFICGHTITQYYYDKLRYEKHWPYRKPGEYVRNRIFRGERFIDIDCGAKCMDFLSEESDDQPLTRIQIMASRAQLAALRLDDRKEFYVHRKAVPIPDAADLPIPKLSEIRIPSVKLPSLSDISEGVSNLLYGSASEQSELSNEAWPGTAENQLQEDEK